MKQRDSRILDSDDDGEIDHINKISDYKSSYAKILQEFSQT